MSLANDQGHAVQYIPYTVGMYCMQSYMPEQICFLHTIQASAGCVGDVTTEQSFCLTLFDETASTISMARQGSS